MICRFKSSGNFEVECPYKQTGGHVVDDNFFYTFHYCLHDIDEDRKCIAKRISKRTNVVNFVTLQF